LQRELVVREKSLDFTSSLAAMGTVDRNPFQKIETAPEHAFPTMANYL
jgi:exosortase/archaeosortase